MCVEELGGELPSSLLSPLRCTLSLRGPHFCTHSPSVEGFAAYVAAYGGITLFPPQPLRTAKVVRKPCHTSRVRTYRQILKDRRDPRFSDMMRRMGAAVVCPTYGFPFLRKGCAHTGLGFSQPAAASRKLPTKWAAGCAIGNIGGTVAKYNSCVNKIGDRG